MAINEAATGNDSVAITGTASAGERTIGIVGQGDSVGVRGVGKNWNGVEGISQSTIGGAGIFGANDTGAGVRGESKARFNPAVHGIHRGVEGPGVLGEAENGSGVIGKSTKWVGVYGETAGIENGPAGVWGEHKGAGVGVKAVSNTGVGLVAFSNGVAAIFQGNVDITGSLTVQGTNINGLAGRVQAVEGLVGRVQSLENRVNTLQQQVNNLQQQLANLQQKQAEDVQGIAVSLATLAARVTALGG